MIPIVAYGWDDETSMQDNNTFAFNYRTILGTDRLSKHALGVAIDINPKLNPAVSESGLVQPKGAVYNTRREGTILADSDVVLLFKSFNWKWGGEWKDDKDWQHFEKV